MTFIGKFIDYNGGETDEEKVKGKFRDLCKNTKKDDNRLVCIHTKKVQNKLCNI